MSHITTIKTQIKDAAIAKRVALAMDAVVTEGRHTATFWNKQEHQVDMSIQFPGWTRPVGIDNGQLIIDDMDIKKTELQQFRTGYAVSVAKTRLERQGFRQTSTRETEKEFILEFDHA